MTNDWQRMSCVAVRRQISRTASERLAILLGVLVALMLVLVVDVPAQVTNPPHPVDWVWGDVFVGTGSGSYQVWHSGNPAAGSYTNEQTIADGKGGLTAGCAFDLASRFFGTNSTAQLLGQPPTGFVDRYPVSDIHPVVQHIQSATPGASSPLSVAFDAGPNLYIGYAGGVSSSMGTIERWVKDPNSGLYSFNPALGAKSFSVLVDNTGPGWIDLAFDGSTIFYTSQGRKIYKLDTLANNGSGSSSVWADLSLLNGSNSVGTLFAIKVMGPNYDGTNGVLVADQGNVKLVVAPNGPSTTAVAALFKFKNPTLANIRALALDSFSPSTFWIGDASASTNSVRRFNMSSGNTEATLPTGPVGGVCLDGGFSFNGSEVKYQPHGSNSTPNFKAQPFNLTPPTKANPTSNTFSFTSPFTGETLTGTLPGLSNNVTVTIRDWLAPSSVAGSDPTVYSFNPGNPNQGSTVPGNMPCDQTLTTTRDVPGFGGYPDGTCEVLGFEANPNSGFSLPSLTLDTTDTSETTPNLRLLTDLTDDRTAGVVNYPLRSKCIITVNQQSVLGGINNPTYQICSFTPTDGTTFTKSPGATITFTLSVAPFGQCSNSGNNSEPTFLEPLLMILQLQPENPVTHVTPAAVSINVQVAGKSGGPPIMTLSGNAYQLQVKTADISAGFTYLATVIDLTGTIPSVSSTFIMHQ